MDDASAAAPLALPEPHPPAEPPAEAPGKAQARRPFTRREALVALVAGGAAVVVTNSGTALATERISTALANRRAQTQIDDLQAKIGRLEKQLALYKDMERIGLDKVIRTALEAYDRFWPPIRSGVQLLLGAIRIVEEGIAHFELKLPTLRSASSILADLLTGLEAQTKMAQDTLNSVLERTGAIGEAVSGFFSWLLSRNPFGITSAMREAADRVSALVSGFPLLISDVRRRLLGPLDEEWLAASVGRGLQGILFDPLRSNLITPLRAHLEQIDRAASSWADDSKPIRDALQQREKMRGEIARLEREEQYAEAAAGRRG